MPASPPALCTCRSDTLEEVPAYADVALPVPLDQLFTYAVNGVVPVAGARVLVPFSGQKLMGVVTRVHDDAPDSGIEIKPIQQVLDAAPLLPDELMELARWIARYYVAPLGEVLRGMMPLAAEVRRQFTYRITESGRRVLYEGAEKGSSRRSKLSAEDQNREYSVLNYLENGETAKANNAARRHPGPASRCSTAWCASAGSFARRLRRSAMRGGSSASRC